MLLLSSMCMWNGWVWRTLSRTQHTQTCTHPPDPSDPPPTVDVCTRNLAIFWYRYYVLGQRHFYIERCRCSRCHRTDGWRIYKLLHIPYESNISSSNLNRKGSNYPGVYRITHTHLIHKIHRWRSFTVCCSSENFSFGWKYLYPVLTISFDLQLAPFAVYRQTEFEKKTKRTVCFGYKCIIPQIGELLKLNRVKIVLPKIIEKVKIVSKQKSKRLST